MVSVVSAARGIAGVLGILCATTAPAQTVVPPYGFVPSPAVDDESGFLPIFDGRSLDGWTGDAVHWSVRNGSIIGETTPATLLKDHNSFLVWRRGAVRDFELRLSYRISAEGNSGVNFRSVDAPGIQWAMKGYQFDIDGAGAVPISRRIML